MRFLYLVKYVLSTLIFKRVKSKRLLVITLEFVVLDTTHLFVAVSFKTIFKWYHVSASNPNPSKEICTEGCEPDLTDNPFAVVELHQ